MRILQYLLFLAFASFISFASVASATTVKGHVISITYDSLATVGVPFSNDGIFEDGKPAKLKIFVSNNRTETAIGNRNVVTDPDGWIRIFNGNGQFVPLSDTGVQIVIRNGEVRFGSLERGNDLPAQQTWLSYSQNFNTIISDTNAFRGPSGDRRSVDVMLATLADEDFDLSGGTALNVKRRRNQSSGSRVRLESDAGPSSVTATTVVPLPAGVWLLLGGLGMMALRRKRAA